MSAVTQTISFFTDGPGYQYLQALPAGERSSWVRSACDAAAQGGEERPGELLQEIVERLDRIERKLTAGHVARQPVEMADSNNSDDPRLDKLTNLGL
jgi:hypothetical protein